MPGKVCVSNGSKQLVSCLQTYMRIRTTVQCTVPGTCRRIRFPITILRHNEYRTVARGRRRPTLLPVEFLVLVVPPIEDPLSTQ